MHEGDTLIQKDLGQTLSAIAEQGPRGFYQGPVAEKLVKAIRGAGGIMTLDDLKSYQPTIRVPVHGSYRGYDIISMPLPSSGGVVLLETLNILEGFPLPDMKQGSAPSLHLLIEAMKRAYADRAHYLGDPASVTAPVARLMTKEYAAKQRAGIDLDHAAPWTDQLLATATPAPTHEGSNTTHFSVVDSAGNAVSNTYTLNYPYGVGLVAEGTGVLLNDELDDFTAALGASNAFGLVGFEANLPGPGKRPLSSMTPTIVLKDGKVVLVTGSPGGSRIISTVLQVIVDVLDYHMDVAAAVRDSPAAPSMDAGSGSGRTRFSRRCPRGLEGRWTYRGRTARPNVSQFHRRDGQWIAWRPRSAYPWRRSRRLLAVRSRDHRVWLMTTAPINVNLGDPAQAGRGRANESRSQPFPGGNVTMSSTVDPTGKVESRRSRIPAFWRSTAT